MFDSTPQELRLPAGLASKFGSGRSSCIDTVHLLVAFETLSFPGYDEQLIHPPTILQNERADTLWTALMEMSQPALVAMELIKQLQLLNLVSFVLLLFSCDSARANLRLWKCG
jgi:hypothetical protein